MTQCKGPEDGWWGLCRVVGKTSLEEVQWERRVGRTGIWRDRKESRAECVRNQTVCGVDPKALWALVPGLAVNSEWNGTGSFKKHPFGYWVENRLQWGLGEAGGKWERSDREGVKGLVKRKSGKRVSGKGELKTIKRREIKFALDKIRLTLRTSLSLGQCLSCKYLSCVLPESMEGLKYIIFLFHGPPLTHFPL